MILEHPTASRIRSRCLHLSHVTTEDLIEGCGLFGVVVEALGHLPRDEVAPLQRFHQVP